MRSGISGIVLLGAATRASLFILRVKLLLLRVRRILLLDGMASPFVDHVAVPILQVGTRVVLLHLMLALILLDVATRGRYRLILLMM